MPITSLKAANKRGSVTRELGQEWAISLKQSQFNVFLSNILQKHKIVWMHCSDSLGPLKRARASEGPVMCSPAVPLSIHLRPTSTRFRATSSLKVTIILNLSWLYIHGITQCIYFFVFGFSHWTLFWWGSPVLLPIAIIW